MKKLFYTLFLFSSLGFSRHRMNPATTFDAVFDIDAVHTKDAESTMNFLLQEMLALMAKHISLMFLQITTTALLMENLRICLDANGGKTSLKLHYKAFIEKKVRSLKCTPTTTQQMIIKL